MKIYFFAHYFPPGNDAASVTTERIIRYLARRHRLTVFIPWRSNPRRLGDVQIIMAPKMWTIFTLSLPHIVNAWLSWGLIRRGDRPDLILVQYIPHQLAALGGYLCHLISKRPLVLRSHDIIPVYPSNGLAALHVWITNIINRWVAQRASLMTVVSPELIREAEKFGLRRSHITIHSNAAEIPPQTNMASNTPLVFFAGSIQPEDNLELLVRSWRKVVLKIPKAKLIIAGKENKRLARLKTMASQLGVEKSILFLGEIYHHQVVAWIRKAALCIGPLGANIANRSAVPRKAVEYMAAGKPMISVQLSRSLLIDGKTGIVVEDLTPNILADKIVWALTHPTASRTIGERARRHIQRQFSWPTNLKHLECLLAETARQLN